jgi:NAD(P)-dependent dehydrogenase (short-subunit alcohol dehydrogenase family)
MKKQTVIVTGASSGIGLGIARHFLGQGDNVVISAQDRLRLEASFHELGSPDRLAMLAGDISDKWTGKAIVSLAMQRFGSVDVLVNNAGIYGAKAFLEVEEADLDRFLSINLKGTWFATQAAIRQMLLQEDGGSIVNIGASRTEHGIAGGQVSAAMASKGAIHTLTIQLAAEFGANNIRVNTIAPGVIDTALHDKAGVVDADTVAPLQLLHRVGQVSDIAETVYLVAKNGFITGTTVNVDGGFAAGCNLKNNKPN